MEKKKVDVHLSVDIVKDIFLKLCHLVRNSSILKLMIKQKGFAPILILIGVLIITAIGGIYYLGIRKPANPFPSSIPAAETSHTPQPTPAPVRPDNFILANIWQMGLLVYINSQLNISFQYPKSFIVRVHDISSFDSVLKPLFSVTFVTPDVPIEKKGEEGFDFYSYDANTMWVRVAEYDNPNNLSVYDFIAQQNKTYPGNGITETFDTFKKYLKPTNQPKDGSYVFEGIIGENPSKEVYFENKGKIYVFSLGGGNNTGEGYSKDADNVFNQMITSVKFTQ